MYVFGCCEEKFKHVSWIYTEWEKMKCLLLFIQKYRQDEKEKFHILKEICMLRSKFNYVVRMLHYIHNAHFKLAWSNSE